jgi:hypothetical protein
MSANGRDGDHIVQGSHSIGERLLAPVVGQFQADERAAAERVEALRKEHPAETTDQIVERLIKRKCQQTAIVGAITGGAAAIPAVGPLIAVTIGTAADVGAMLRLHAELVLEIAAAHDRRLTADERQRAMVIVTGVSVGSGQLLTRGGRVVSQRVGRLFAVNWMARALPIVGVATSAGTNGLVTYIIGRRAHAYFAVGPEAMRSWQDELRALTGVDEHKLGAWLAETGDRAREFAGRGAGRTAAAGARVWEATGHGVGAAARRVGALVPGRPKEQAALPPVPGRPKEQAALPPAIAERAPGSDAERDGVSKGNLPEQRRGEVAGDEVGALIDRYQDGADDERRQAGAAQQRPEA